MRPTDPQPGRGPARRQPRHARPPRPGALRDLHAAPSSRRRSSASDASSTSRWPSFRPTTRASTWSACTGCPRSPTRRCSTPAPGPTTARRSATRSRSPGCPRSRSTSPTSTRARSGAGARCSTAWCSAAVAGKGPDGYRRGAREAAARSSAYELRPSVPTGSPTLVAERELDQLIVGDLVRPGGLGAGRDRQRALAHRLHRHQRAGRHRRRERGPSSPTSATSSGLSSEVGDGFDRGIAAERLLPELASQPARPGRLRRRGDQRRRSRASSRSRARPRGRAGGGRRTRRAAAPAQGRDRDRRRSPRRRGSPTRPMRRCSRRARAGAPSARSRGRPQARIRELGGEPSFAAIVAAGPNGALPHAEPRSARSATGELVVWDMGAKVDGYCSDCTRTFAVGESRRRGARGLRARPACAGCGARRRSRPGVDGVSADAAARAVIRDGRPRRPFGHGLGHGVGLEVHEAPRLGKRSEDVLEPGDVVTVEPGVYVPGRFGDPDRGPGRGHRGRAIAT